MIPAQVLLKGKQTESSASRTCGMHGWCRMQAARRCTTRSFYSRCCAQHWQPPSRVASSWGQATGTPLHHRRACWALVCIVQGEGDHVLPWPPAGFSEQQRGAIACDRSSIPTFIRVHKHNQNLQDDAADVSLAERPWLQEQNACVYTHGVKSAVGERGRCTAALSAIHH